MKKLNQEQRKLIRDIYVHRERLNITENEVNYIWERYRDGVTGVPVNEDHRKRLNGYRKLFIETVVNIDPELKRSYEK